MARDGLLAQLRRIADAVEVLPEVRDRLDKLDSHVTEMSAEVTRMREGVDDLKVSVGTLNDKVDSLNEHFDGMRGDIAGLDIHLDQVKKSLHPLRALAGLGGRLRG